MHPPGILFVCLGNICRSPMAESVMTRALEERGAGEAFRVESCGTAAFNAGKPADRRAMAALAAAGYRLDAHVARQIRDEDFGLFRYIVAMDRANLHTLQAWLPAGFSGELNLLLHYAPGGASREVADPYHAGAEAFSTTLREIERGVHGLLERLLEEASAGRG